MVQKRFFKSYGSTEAVITKSDSKTFSLKTVGLSMALLSAFIGAFKGLLVNKLAGLGPVEIFCARSLGTTTIILPAVIFSTHTIFPDLTTIKWLVLRAIFGNIAVTGYYFGFAYLPMGTASVIYYSCPIYTIIFGKIFLHEKFGLSEFLSTMMSMFGLFLVSQRWIFGSEWNDPNTILGLAGSIIGAVAQAGAFVFLKKLEAVPTIIVTFYWSSIGTILSVVIIIATRTFRVATCGVDGVMVVSVAILGTLSELCLTYALSLVEASSASIALTSEIIWAFVFQYCFEKTGIPLFSVLGAIFVVLAIVLPYVTRYVEALRCLPIVIQNLRESKTSKTSKSKIEILRTPCFVRAQNFEMVRLQDSYVSEDS